LKKNDFKKEMKYLFNPSIKEVVVVDVPIMNFLMIDGLGDPNTSQEYQDALEALYGITFTIKMLPKKGKTPNGYFEYVVPPLEGLWWSDEKNNLDLEDKDKWKWTAMFMQPEFVTQNLVDFAMELLQKKKDVPSLSKIRFESYNEGLSAQIMHLGPYAEEAPTIEKIHKFIDENGYKFNGKHHEIYLSDPRRCAPEKLRTVIRQAIV